MANTHPDTYAKDDIRNYMIVMSPSPMGVTINANNAALQGIAIARGQKWVHIDYGKPGIVGSRNMCMQGVKQMFSLDRSVGPTRNTTIRAMWLDDDIMILNPTEVLEAMNYADQHNINIVANYARGNPPNLGNTLYQRWRKAYSEFSSTESRLVVKQSDIHGTLRMDTQQERDSFDFKDEIYNIDMTDEEIHKLRNYDRVDCAGLGFYYGWVPLDYKFHTDLVGEDFYFYLENKLELRFAKKIRLDHRQTCWLRPSEMTYTD